MGVGLASLQIRKVTGVKAECVSGAVVNYSDRKLLAYYENTFVGISGHFLHNFI